MARSIRLSGAAGGASGLSTSDVTSLIQSNSRFVLDKKYTFTSAPDNPFTVIPNVDFDNVEVYLIVGRGVGPNSNGAYRYLHFGTAAGNHAYRGWQSGAFYASSSNYSSGTVYMSPNGHDSYQGGENNFEMKIYINEKDAPNYGRRIAKVHYQSEVTNPGGYQNYSVTYHHGISANADWSDISIASSVNFGLANTVTTPSFTVYKQLRVPAS
jgi:hypothetical protein